MLYCLLVSYFRDFALLMKEAGVQRTRNQEVCTCAHRMVTQEAGDKYLSLGFLLVC